MVPGPKPGFGDHERLFLLITPFSSAIVKSRTTVEGHTEAHSRPPELFRYRLISPAPQTPRPYSPHLPPGRHIQHLARRLDQLIDRLALLRQQRRSVACSRSFASESPVSAAAS